MIAPATPPPTPRDWGAVAEEAPGWLQPEDGPALYGAALVAWKATGRPFLEIGSYAGKSTCYLAAAAREVGTFVLCVDWFRGSPEMAPGRECHHPEMLDPVDGAFDSLPAFRRTIRAAGLEDHVVTLAADSGAAADIVNRYAHAQHGFGLVFIDAAHDMEGVHRDYNLWGRHVWPGGRLVFHDTTVPAIGSAVVRAEGDGFRALSAPHAMAILTLDGRR